MVMGDKTDGIGFRISSKRLPRAWTRCANRILDRLFGFEAFNAAFRAAPECPDSELAQAILDTLGVRLELSGAPKDAMARDGALVVVCNHPFGVIDGLAIAAILQSIRSDVSVIAAHWFTRVPRLENSVLIGVGAQGAQKRRRQSVTGWLAALQRLKRGGAVIIFPAGQAARFRWRRLSVGDLPWSQHVARVVRMTSACVVPVFFEGRNSRIFYALTAIFPGLANFLLVRECLKKSNARVRIVIGQPIAPGELAKFRTDEEAVQFLRRKVEALARQGLA
jgi:putative hemolysin